MERAESPVPLPSAPSFEVGPGLVIQPPLSRGGSGPGLVLLVEKDLPLGPQEGTLDPPPLLKWAEEGFAVAQLMLSGQDSFEADLQLALKELKELNTCNEKERFGLISYCSNLEDHVVDTISLTSAFVAIVTYASGMKTYKQPYLCHTTDVSTTSSPSTKSYTYPTASTHFILPAHAHYDSTAATLAHTRTLTFLKPLVGGPYFDLEAIWEEHTLYEFGERAVAKTMSTMVAEPYVNDIPTLTGGIGREALTAFYTHHFVHVNPPDTVMRLVSRTVGVDRLIDEFVFQATHDRVIDWLIPGVPPTGRKFKVPFTCVISIRGDRLFHEHISWDQATLLRQLGLLPEYLPFPYPLPGRGPLPQGKRLEYRVPALGVETTRKLECETAVASNGLMSWDGEGEFAVREVDL